MKKTIFYLISVTVLSKLIGFARDIVLSYFYGVSYVADAYLISTTIPLTIFAFVGVGIATSYIPMYNQIQNKHGDNEAIKFTNNVINSVLIISTIVIILVLLFTTSIVKMFAAGFNDETLQLAVTLTRISVVGIYFTGIIYVLKSFLQIKDKFLITGLIGIPYNIVIIISIILSFDNNYFVLGLGSVFAVAIQVIILTPSAAINGLNYERVFNLKSKNLRLMMKQAFPASIGVSVDQINVLVDRTIASTLVVGGIAALNYSNRLIYFVQGLFVTTIATVYYPKISSIVAKGKSSDLFRIIEESMVGMMLLILPSAIGLMVFSKQIIELLFARGAFSVEGTMLTESALFFYSFGILGIGLREILSRVFYAMQETKVAVKNAAIGMCTNIALNIILSKYFGISGLALATSIAATFTTAMLIVSLRKKIGPFGMKQISISFLKILFASLVMGGLAKLSFNYLTTSLSQNLSLLIAIGVGAVSYFVIIYFMKIEDVDVIVGAIKKKLGRGAA
ncbi:MAG TPA: murein biosynthesis integral membrane protein MurJ [Eubacteriaceae bacterium]|nr:murein biosynthesis integral membrane protein MurJ [Eubacteriaceae bacterium]